MNRLAHESSPYLRQHADNPVEWYPWGEEAFAAARERGVPILLSIGYSTCHWCHVMAHESFEDAAVAARMNADFVNVKVDREERPDVDGVYMAAVQAMTGAGGWPMTVFLTPDLRPFYAGTYFPPHDAQGMPGFPRVLASVSGAWAEQRDKLEQNAQALTEHVRAASRPQESAGDLPPDLIARAVERLRLSFDAAHGGFGRAPKFPSPTTLRFLLTQREGREMALTTLRAMLAGGIHDQLGGGFHRYSVDARWLVPHFEKMLYDNAQLAQLLLLAWQLSGEEGFLQGARGTLTYLLREMQDAEGGFHSAQDADSAGERGENVEGLYYTWTPEEVRAVLSAGTGGGAGDDVGNGAGDEAEPFLRAYDVTGAGHFMDPHRREYGRRSVPHRPRPHAEVAAELQLSPQELDTHLDSARARLLAARGARVRPGTDDKVLTSWNGLMLSALSDAARLTGDEEYLAAAHRLRDFVDARMTTSDGTLLHTFRAGEARVGGLLEDHALWALGLVSLYQAGGEERDILRARALWDIVRRDFWDDGAGAFAVSGGAAEALIARRTEFFDAAVPGAHPAAVQLAVWMARYFGDADAEALAGRGVRTFAAEMLNAPNGLGTLLLAAAHLQAPDTEVAVIGPQRAVLTAQLRRHALPFTVLALTDEGGGALPLLEGRGPAQDGEALAYVCRGRACLLPTPDVEVFGRQLAELGS